MFQTKGDEWQKARLEKLITVGLVCRMLTPLKSVAALSRELRNLSVQLFTLLYYSINCKMVQIRLGPYGINSVNKRFYTRSKSPPVTRDVKQVLARV